jgi:hypothetical protein
MTDAPTGTTKVLDGDVLGAVAAVAAAGMS